MTNANMEAVRKWLPNARAVRGNVRGSKGFRYWIETDDQRISANHTRIADAWQDAFDRVIGQERCEGCGKPITLSHGVWVHPNGDRVCWWQPEDGMATPADAYQLAKMADEEFS